MLSHLSRNVLRLFWLEKEKVNTTCILAPKSSLFTREMTESCSLYVLLCNDSKIYAAMISPPVQIFLLRVLSRGTKLMDGSSVTTA